MNKGKENKSTSYSIKFHQKSFIFSMYIYIYTNIHIYTGKKICIYIYTVFCCQCTDLHTEIDCAICSVPTFNLFHLTFQFQSPKNAVPPSTPDIRLPTYRIPISFSETRRVGISGVFLSVVLLHAQGHSNENGGGGIYTVIYCEKYIT